MKLKEISPQQQVLMVLSGAFVFLNIITMFKSDKDAVEVAANGPKTTQSIDAITGSISARETKFSNPKLSWYESIFCRGMQRSSNCSFKLLHPFAEEDTEMANMGDQAPKTNHVVYYRGAINKNNALSRSITAPLEEAPPAQIMEVEGE